MKSLSLYSTLLFLVNWPLGRAVKTAKAQTSDYTAEFTSHLEIHSLMFPEELLSTGNHAESLGMGLGSEEGQDVVGAVLAL